MAHINFDDIEVSTKTIIGVSNVLLNIDGIFEHLPITPYTIVPKRRGRKKKEQEPDPNINLPIGSILTVKLHGLTKGVDLKQKKKTDSRKKYFRNSLTIVMKIDKDKLINFKISKNGKFQITGCKSDTHAMSSIRFFWDLIRAKSELYTMNGPDFSIILLNVMTNIDFNVGFIVDREKLDKHMNNNTKYNSLLETSFGYTGVNIKFPAQQYPTDAQIPKLTYNGEWNESIITYKEYFDSLTEKEQQKIIEKDKYTTFLVFHSGNVIMSGLSKPYMRDTFEIFANIIKDARTEIEEKLTN